MNAAELVGNGVFIILAIFGFIFFAMAIAWVVFKVLEVLGLL